MSEIELLTAYRQEMHKIQIKNGFTDEQMTSYRQGFMDAIREYEQRIVADVQPVKHGKWEEVTDYGGWGDTHYRCSVCGEEWYLEDGTPQQNNMNFCPRCGARMDGEQKGEAK